MMLIHEVHVLELRIDVLLLGSAKNVEDHTHVFHSELLIHEFRTVTYVYIWICNRLLWNFWRRQRHKTDNSELVNSMNRSLKKSTNSFAVLDRDQGLA